MSRLFGSNWFSSGWFDAGLFRGTGVDPDPSTDNKGAISANTGESGTHTS